MEIEIFDQNSVDALQWPETQEATLARAYLLPLVKEGVKAYISNVETELYLLRINTTILPITVNDREYDNSYLTSNYFPIKYYEEQLSKKLTLINVLCKHLIQAAGIFLKAIKINKVVIVNNWLLTTNIYPKLSSEEINALTDFLTQRFPDHMLLFRSLNSRKCFELTQCLEKAHYRLLFARNVCIYDPNQKEQFSSKVFYHHRRDRRLIQEENYEIVRYHSLTKEEIERLLNLYTELYLKRHTQYSPHFTEKFLRETLDKKILQLVGLKKGSKIYAVIGFLEREKTLIAPFCGYEHATEEAGHLYRMLTILAIDEAEKREVVLNDGSGGEAPKHYRGMKSFPEYVALYDRHLPAPRRLIWGLAEHIVKRLARKSASSN
jgi:hypothetical protein